MNRYSLTLREITEQHNIFNFDYPFYSVEHKHVFEQKFINKFMFREIGTPTPYQFIHFLKTTLNEIMPYYVDLYKTTQFDYEPLTNYDVVEMIENDSSATSESFSDGVQTQNSSNTNNDTGLTKNSDTPNGATDLNNPKSVSDMQSNTNASNGESEVIASSESKNKGVQSGNGTTKRTMKGDIGVSTTQDLIQKERDVIINIDEMILNHIEIKQLFMGVY